MNHHHALILLWTGRALRDDVLEEMVSLLTKHGITIPEMLTAVYKDENAIANSVIRDANGLHMNVEIAETKADEAFKIAVVYLGKRYEKFLMQGPNYANFAFKLMADMNAAYLSGNDNELKNACEIIANFGKPIGIGVKFIKENHFSNAAFDVVKQVYNHFNV